MEANVEFIRMYMNAELVELEDLKEVEEKEYKEYVRGKKQEAKL